MDRDRQVFTHPLAAARAARDWTQLELARRVAVACGANMAAWKQKIWRWEHGVQPDDIAQTALAGIFGIDRRFLTTLPWPQWLTLADGNDMISAPWTAEATQLALARAVGAHMDRRGFLTLTGGGLGAVAAGWTAPWQIVPAAKVAAAADGGRVDAEIIAAMETRLAQLWVMDDLIGGEQCAKLADADLRLAVDLLTRGTCNADIDKRLHALIAGLCRSAGWGAFDAGHHAAAERYWSAGIRAARQADDAGNGVYILSNWAMQHFYSGDGNGAIELLNAARSSHSSLSQTEHAMLDTWQVRAHAALGEGRQAAQMLMSAETHWEARRPEDDPPWIYWMARPTTTIEPNLALIELGEPAAVEENLSQWTEGDHGDHEYTRDRVLALTVIARAQLDQGRDDQAIATGRQALNVLRQIDSTRVADELQLVLDRLPDTQSCQEFRDEVREESARAE